VSQIARMMHLLASTAGMSDPLLAAVAQTETLMERADKLLANLRRAQQGRRAARIEAARHHAHMQKSYRAAPVELNWYKARDASSVTRAKARRAQRAWDEFRAAHPDFVQARARLRRLKAEERRQAMHPARPQDHEDVMKKPKRVDTGRIVSTRPALQDLPLRTEEGRRIRDALEPPREVLVDVDYTSLEVRLLVAMKEAEP